MTHDVAPVVEAQRQFQLVEVWREQPRQHRREVAPENEQLTVPVHEAVELLQPPTGQQRPVGLEVVEDGQQDLGETALLQQRRETRLQPAAPLRAVEQGSRHPRRQAGGDLHGCALQTQGRGADLERQGLPVIASN